MRDEGTSRYPEARPMNCLRCLCIRPRNNAGRGRVPILASVMPEAEDMLAASDAAEEILEQRKFELALQLTEQYRGLLSHWLWGDSVLRMDPPVRDHLRMRRHAA